MVLLGYLSHVFLEFTTHKKKKTVLRIHRCEVIRPRARARTLNSFASDGCRGIYLQPYLGDVETL
jgi:hypothetical protein